MKTEIIGQDFSVTFWGTRGSIATPGPETVEFGGNTSCVEVRAGSLSIIFDTGTGVRKLGQKMMKERKAGPLSAHIFYSHVHWDHIQGLPFFTPLFVPGSQLKFYGPKGDMPLSDVLAMQMSYPVFPIRLCDLASSLSFRDLVDGEVIRLSEDVTVTCAKLNHPGGVLAYRVDYAGRSVVYATDTEHYSCVDPKLVRLCKGADMLIYDAMYDDDEYAGRKGAPRTGWGHSTWTEAVKVAEAAGVSTLVLFHHDPAHDDSFVRQIEVAAQAARPGEGKATLCAREGSTLAIGADRVARSEGVAA